MLKSLHLIADSLSYRGPASFRRPDCCILGTRVAIEVLAAFRIESRPLTVHVRVGNAAYARLAGDAGAPIDTDEFRRYASTLGGESLRLGGPDGRGGGWPHHLIAIVEGRYILDLTIGQAAWHRDNDFLVHPELIPCDEAFLAGRSTLRHIAPPLGCYLEYQAFPGELSYEQAPDWCYMAGLIDRVIEQISSDLNTWE